MSFRRRQSLLFALVSALVLFSAIQSIWQWSVSGESGWTGANFRTITEWGKAPTLEVERVDALSPAYRAGLRPGDRILEINGTADRQLEVSRKLKVGEQVHYKVQRPDGEHEIAVTTENPLKRFSFIFHLSLNALSGLVFLGIGTFVYWKKPDDTRTLVFFLMCSVAGIARLLSTGRLFAYAVSPEANLPAIGLLLGTTFLFFPGLLHFCLIFPRKRPVLTRYPTLLRWIYGLPLGSAVLIMGLLVLQILAPGRLGVGLSTLFPKLREGWTAYQVPVLIALFVLLLPLVILLLRRFRQAIGRMGWKRAIILHPGRTIAILVLLPLFLAAGLWPIIRTLGIEGWPQLVVSPGVFIVYIAEVALFMGLQWLGFPVAACIALYRSYRTSTLEERQQVRWPLWGIVTGVSVFLLAGPLIDLTRFLLRIHDNSQAHAFLYYLRENLDQLGFLLIPIAFAFAILK